MIWAFNKDDHHSPRISPGSLRLWIGRVGGERPFFIRKKKIVNRAVRVVLRSLYVPIAIDHMFYLYMSCLTFDLLIYIILLS